MDKGARVVRVDSWTIVVGMSAVTCVKKDCRPTVSSNSRLRMSFSSTPRSMRREVGMHGVRETVV